MRRRRASEQLLELLADNVEPADGPYDFGSGRATAWAKRRRLRKGTFSCIECKRRKVRCHFGAGQDVDESGGGQGTCVSCRRHGVQCVGQELQSPSPSPLSRLADAGGDQEQRQYSHLGERISEVEALVEELIRQRMGGEGVLGEERRTGEEGEAGASWDEAESDGPDGSHFSLDDVLPPLPRPRWQERDHPMSSSGISGSGANSSTSDLAHELIQLAVCLQTLGDVAEAGSPRSGETTTTTPLASMVTSSSTHSTPPSPRPLVLERRHTAIIARIVARNRRLDRPGARCHRGQQVYYDDVWETRDIDYAFQQAAAALPPRWWAVPDMITAAAAAAAAAGGHGQPSWAQRADAVARILGQSKHFYLLVLLHLPYLTERRAPEGADTTTPNHPPETCSTVAFDTSYSTLSACSAAREVLARASAFWAGRQAARHQEGSRRPTATSTTSYCAIDLEAFVACVALLLAHLDGHGRAAVVVQHQRLADVAAVTAAIDHLATLSHADGEIRIGAGAELLRRLLAVEAEAEAEETEETTATGEPANTLHSWAARRRRRPRYDVWAEEGTLGRGDGRIVDDGVDQILSVPYFGTVHIRRL